MATPNKHIDQWRHNRAFLSAVPPEYPDWMVTAAFYTALHAVDTLLAADRQSVTTHGVRNDILIRTNRYQHIWKHYQQLYDLSRTIRYLAAPEKWVPAESVMRQVVERLLYPIEKSVKKLIGNPELELPAIELQA